MHRCIENRSIRKARSASQIRRSSRFVALVPLLALVRSVRFRLEIAAQPCERVAQLVVFYALERLGLVA